MTETVLPFHREPAATHRLIEREMAARARAEAEADALRDLARDLLTRLAWLEADNRRLVRAVHSRLLPLAWQAAVWGLTACAVAWLAGL